MQPVIYGKIMTVIYELHNIDIMEATYISKALHD